MYNGFQGSKDENTIQTILGDAVDQVSISLLTHENINLFMDNDINQQHHNE